jgi:hypothetical protein
LYIDFSPSTWIWALSQIYAVCIEGHSELLSHSTSNSQEITSVHNRDVVAQKKGTQLSQAKSPFYSHKMHPTLREWIGWGTHEFYKRNFAFLKLLDPYFLPNSATNNRSLLNKKNYVVKK